MMPPPAAAAGKNGLNGQWGYKNSDSNNVLNCANLGEEYKRKKQSHCLACSASNTHCQRTKFPCNCSRHRRSQKPWVEWKSKKVWVVSFPAGWPSTPRHATPRHARRTLTYDALAGVHTSLTCCDEQYKEGNLLEGRSLPNHIYILPSNFQYSPWFQFWICPLH